MFTRILLMKVGPTGLQRNLEIGSESCSIMKEEITKEEEVTFHLRKAEKIIIMRIVKLVKQEDVQEILMEGIQGTGGMEDLEIISTILKTLNGFC